MSSLAKTVLCGRGRLLFIVFALLEAVQQCLAQASVAVLMGVAIQ